MANALDALLARITDKDLRQAIAHEVARLKDSRDFGLVFERHLPESVRLSDYPISRGSQVQERSKVSGPTWYVEKIEKGVASLVEKTTGEPHKLPLQDLVALKGFGEVVYPGLKNVGRVQRGGDKSSNVVINGENYYVLESLLYAFEEKIDAIYIDPPYNTGARDWKYNNDYVDSEDSYRHSKWLAFMERRLLLAKKLLNPSRSALLVTIDEKEYLRLGLLIEQVFPDARVQMVTSVISSQGSVRDGMFTRSDEYLFFVLLGDLAISKSGDDMLNEGQSETKGQLWFQFVRTGKGNLRSDSKNLFYPIFVDTQTGAIHSIGEALPLDMPRESVQPQLGTTIIWPMSAAGEEARWRTGVAVARRRVAKGLLRASKSTSGRQEFSIMTVNQGTEDRIESGEVVVDEIAANGAAKLREVVNSSLRSPKTTWNKTSHNAGWHGSKLLATMLPGRRFPYPKSLYAVEDALQFLVGSNPDAVVLDFFAGSGTTGHALMRLNKQDDGNRRFILVTNNEVSSEEAQEMRTLGRAPGDVEWESRGIYEHVTKPRIEAAVTGLSPDGDAIKGDYKFNDEFPISDGFEENVEFLELQYLDSNNVSRGKAFELIAPLIWMKAGFGPVMLTEERPDFALEDKCNYAILFNVERWHEFIKAVRANLNINHVFIITDSRATYQQVIQEMDSDVKTTMLYEDYLRNFEISIGGQ
jgi:adenine-specific DNA-methyltransferase